MTNKEHKKLVILSLSKDLNYWGIYNQEIYNDKLDCMIRVTFWSTLYLVNIRITKRNSSSKLYNINIFTRIIFLYYYLKLKRLDRIKDMNNIQVDVDESYIQYLKRDNTLDEILNE